jgi:hypothetical protein
MLVPVMPGMLVNAASNVKRPTASLPCKPLSHTKCFSSRFEEVNFPTNPSTYPLLLPVCKIS